jgi:hypothetical protein
LVVVLALLSDAPTTTLCASEEISPCHSSAASRLANARVRLSLPERPWMPPKKILKEYCKTAREQVQMEVHVHALGAFVCAGVPPNEFHRLELYELSGEDVAVL